MQVSVANLDVVPHPYLQCPNCNTDMKSGVEFYSGESLFPPEQSGWKAKEQYWGHILLCICPDCEAGLYALEISVLSHPIKGKVFANDDSYSEQLVETKLVEAGSWEWLIDRRINVRFEDDASHDYAGQSMPSIDVHTIGLFMEGEDIFKTQENAKKMFQLFLPYIKHAHDVKSVL